MNAILIIGLILIGLVVLLIIIGIIMFISSYNKLVTLKNRVENGWSQIDVVLKKRFDLIPNLVETVKGYAKHESGVFDNVAKLRTAAANASTHKESIDANEKLSKAVVNLFATAEQYPDLKANQNFMALQKQLEDVESKITFSRQFYNDTVMKYNDATMKFPCSIIASIFHFEPMPYFQIESNEKCAPKVKF